jgi:glycolate oxidase FAD binding subunit
VSGQIRLDWGGALAWIALPPAQAELDVHALVANAAGRDGHAQLLYRPAGLTSAFPAQPRLDPGLAALSARVKVQFDPAGILSPAATPGGSA